MGFGSKLFLGSLALAGVCYLGHACVNSNTGYNALENTLRIADKGRYYVGEFAEPGRERMSVLTHTRVDVPEDYFKKNTFRAAGDIDEISGYAQIAAGIGMGIAGLLGLAYIFGKKED